jgi:aldehyde dehydrogenase (NAD+)
MLSLKGKTYTMTEFSYRKKLELMSGYFSEGETKPYSFRREKLIALKKIIIKYENQINEALFKDLKKSVEESYATEIGLLIAEINTALKNLHRWMEPERVATNLVNLPSSCRVYHDPLGVVLIIGPWNYPLQLALIPLVGAIAGGNCIAIKPSELAPATASIIEQMIGEIYPEKYVCVFPGDGASVIPEMMEAFRFDHIFFTGSIPVGKIIYQLAAKNLIPVSLELGGKSPAVVEADANLAVTVRRIAVAKFVNVGQTCIAPDYVLVDEKIKDQFVRTLKETLVDFFGSDPGSNTSYGKVISEKRFDKLQSYLGQGEIIFGGNHDRSRLYFAPTLMQNVPLNSPLMTEEIFGPILPVLGFRSTEEAISIINRNPKPLSFYVFSASGKKQKAWTDQISFGGGCINNAAWHFANHHLPFGGTGNSGIGNYHGKYSFDAFTHKKAMMKTPTWLDPKIKYPPFNGKLNLFKLFFR